jgi:hypothetical protein
LIQAQLFGIQATDRFTMAAAALGIAAVAALSGHFSARRATTIDPVRAPRGSSAERCGAARSGRPREAGVASAAVRGDRPTIKLNVCGTTHAFCPLRRAPR